MAKERFEFIKRYVGTIGHFDPRLTMVSNHVRFALGIKSNGFTGI
jgi:hypothetical protein